MRKKIIALCAVMVLSSGAYAGHGRTDGAHHRGAVKPVKLQLHSAAALIYDEDGGQTLYGKNTDVLHSIASITKLMTAMVVLDGQLPLDESITIREDDVDTLKGSRSKLQVGTTLSRRELLKLALMASENRAAAALGRSYPGGIQVFVALMNRKAQELGMMSTRFVDSTGLNSENVSTAQDLVKMVEAAYQYDLIREFTTSSSHEVEIPGHVRSLQFRNSNRLVRNKSWEIGLSKTGFINEAGRCLVMWATIAAKPVVIVLLDSWGRNTRIGDANRIKKWMETSVARRNRMS